MKLLKKLLAGAAVAVAALSMMSCGGLSGLMQRTFGEDLFYYQDATFASGAYGAWTIRDEENTATDEWVRGVKMFFTQHSDLACYIELDVKANTGSGDGVIGVAFDVVHNKDKTWDFGVAGVRYVKVNGEDKAEYYVSHFFNVSDEDMSKKNFGANIDDKDVVALAKGDKYDTEGREITGPYEIVVNKYEESRLDGVYFPNSENAVPSGTIKVVVQVKEDSVTGDYVVNFYNLDSYYPNANTDAEAIKGNPIASSKKMLASSIGKSGPRQAYVGVYANIYGGKTLKGFVQCATLKNDAIIAY